MSTVKQAQKMEAYYSFHARIYQATRWTFLFGRERIVKLLVAKMKPHEHLLEIGCGTGHNLHAILKLGKPLQLTGLDISSAMLSVAQKRFVAFPPSRIRLIKSAFGQENLPSEASNPSAILCSYVLTMMNPGYAQAINQACDIIAPGGLIGVVDFHTTSSPGFARWMRKNHVVMEEHLLPELEQRFETILLEEKSVWFGLWKYVIYIGKKVIV
jgi:S-adenosylmethionine-diacylgycerolhomoserine-N-methlytransferase